ncbi:MAG: HD domain-containing protein, partial [Gammaproteobacteria bacterium]
AFTAPPSAINLNHAHIELENGEIKFNKEYKQTLPIEPWHLFELFALFSEHTEAYQISANTQRIIEKYRHLIPEHCYLDPQYQQLFLRILRSPKVSNTLELLHEYGLLAKYITEFSPITGMMQYDLFHAYPVDQHTLFLVKNLSDFVHQPNTALFPLAATVAKQISKPEILYLAGIFHDIGKGRGGAHEDIGAEFIQDFAKVHNFSDSEIELMRWLVQDHLLLSHTAQHQDITNPAIIEEFAAKVKNTNTLNHLYLLTIADIYATNNKLWTAWRSSLIDTLYQETNHLLHETSHQPKTVQDIIAEKQQEALALINDESKKNALRNLWQQFNFDYFMSRTPEELTQQATFILAAEMLPVITIAQHHSKSATEIFIYTQQHEELFLAITSLLTKLQLSIVTADINTTTKNFNLGTYIVLQRNNQPLDNETHIARVIQRIQEQLQHLEIIQTPELKHLPTRLQALNYPPVIKFAPDTHSNSTTMSLYTPDRPGLLAHIARVCYNQHIQIHRAQINTLG